MIRNVTSVLALIGLLVASGFAIGWQGVQWQPVGGDWSRATLELRDANGLIPRSRVLLRGVPIGEVTAVTPDAKNVSVEFAYHPDVPLPINSVFRVESLSALGESYLAIKPTSIGGPTLVNGQRLVADAAAVSGTFGELAVTLSQLAKALDPGEFNGIVDELSTAFSDRAAIPVLTDFNSRLNGLVAADKGQIRNILAQVQVLLQHDDVMADSAARLADAIPPTLNSMGRLMDAGAVLVLHSGDYPADIQNGVGVLLSRVTAFEKDIALPLYNLTNPLLPVMQATAAAMSTIDSSRLLDASLDALETPGAFTVHVLPSGS